MPAIPNEAGPSRVKPAPPVSAEPKEDVDDPRSNIGQTASTAGPAQAEEGDEDEERMDFKAIESIASKIQYAEGSGRAKIVIPKRGEKDFEPLQETVNLQEMMLQKSREALFNALVGVRGGNSKSMSHALLTPGSTYPKMIITRGHIHDSLGIAVRHSTRFSKQTTCELLPEEALYLLERGSLQIWVGPEPETETEYALGVGTWKDEEWGIKGAVEMSVLEGYGAFIGKEGLSWEKYQAYAYLKRLGYTVQRAPQFIPDYFDPPRLHVAKSELPPFRPWWFSLPQWLGRLVSAFKRTIMVTVRGIGKVGLDLAFQRQPLRKTLLSNWHGADYASIFAHLRIIPTGHSQPLPPRPTPPSGDSIYSCLEHNPYIPFFHIWKPATPWSKSKWQKGSVEGLLRQKPDYIAAIIDGRTVPMPTIHQLSEVFDTLPDEPKGPVKRLGPQYERRARPRTQRDNTSSDNQPWYARLFPFLASKEEEKPYINPMSTLRNGDRALVVAVNDSGNTGWVRFARSGFAEAAVM